MKHPTRVYNLIELDTVVSFAHRVTVRALGQ